MIGPDGLLIWTTRSPYSVPKYVLVALRGRAASEGVPVCEAPASAPDDPDGLLFYDARGRPYNRKGLCNAPVRSDDLGFHCTYNGKVR